MTRPTQCVVLCGGLGTRLGMLTERTPKPLLPVNGVPFLDLLLTELGRQGFRRILLLARFEAEKIATFVENSAARQRFGLDVILAIEPDQAGTGGALWHARDRLDETFYLLNGDTWFDVPLRALEPVAAVAGRGGGCVMALRPTTDTSRYGVVSLDSNRITALDAPQAAGGPALINGGVYRLTRDLVALANPSCSLEQDVLPKAIARGMLHGRAFAGHYFIDIGVPSSYAAAQTEIPEQCRKPAIFLDRDGVLNIDHGHVGQVDRLELVPGAGRAVAWLNEQGYYVFVVTNQAGIAKGLYDEVDYAAVMTAMRDQLAAAGGHIDDVRFCPFHADAVDPIYRIADHPWRKPRPGMLLDLMACWPINAAGSVMIGDRLSDIDAGRGAGLRALLFPGGDLAEFICAHVPALREKRR